MRRPCRKLMVKARGGAGHDPSHKPQCLVSNRAELRLPGERGAFLSVNLDDSIAFRFSQEANVSLGNSNSEWSDYQVLSKGAW
jgi:hypothetical protein